LHIYLTRQILASLLMTVIVFTFVLLLGNALKDILSLLATGQVRFGLVAEAVVLLVPFVWVFALPMGMLTATLLIFGRFSADQEYTAVRASGISLISLISPILMLSVALCGVSALLNMEVGPRCRVAYTSLRNKLRSQFSGAYLPEHAFIKDFPGYIFYIGKNRNGDLQDVLVFALKNETNADYRVRAPRGRMFLNESTKKLSLTLYDAKILTFGKGQDTVVSMTELPFEIDSGMNGPGQATIDDMSFMQLWDELHDLERRLSLPVSLKGTTPEQRQARKKEAEQLRKDLGPVVFTMHRQVAYSFACFGFTLVGIPLGIRVHRRETNIGIAIALILVAIYYSFLMIGQSLNSRPECVPHLIVWMPNFLFEAVGVVLLWRANRGA
jgi:lipopolysaccharide export system permease protein